MLRGIGVAVDSGVVVPVHQVVGAVGRSLDGNVGTGHHSIGGVGHDSADAVGAGVAVDLDGGDAVHVDAVYLTGGGFGINAVTFHRGREGCQVVHKRVLVVLPEDAQCDGVALGGFDGHCAVLKPSKVVRVTTDVVQRHRDDAVGRLAVGGLAGGRDGGQQGLLSSALGHDGFEGAAVVMDEGEGVGSEDHGGEVGAVVGHDAAVVDHVDGGSAGGVDAERLRIEGVSEAHHIGVAGAETEEARAGILEGIHVGVKELIVRREDEFGDSIRLEAVVGAEGVAVGQDDVVVLPSQLGSVLGEGGADGLVLRQGEAGGAVAVVGHVAAPALEVVVHLGHGHDGEGAVVIDHEGVKGGVGRDYAVEAVSGGVVEFETFIIGVGDVIADVAYGDVELLLHAVLELYSDVTGAFVSVEDIGCPGGDVGAAQGAGLFAADGLVVGQVDVGVGDEGQGGAAHTVQRQGAAVVGGEGERGLGLEVGGEGFGGDDAVVGLLDGDVAVALGGGGVVAEADEVVLGVGGGHDGDRGAVVYIICIRSAGSDDVGADGGVDLDAGHGATS